MEFNKEYRAKILRQLPRQLETAVWKRVYPLDRNRFDCERFDMCSEDATWTTVQGNLHVCDYHRFIFDIERIAERLGAELSKERAA